MLNLAFNSVEDEGCRAIVQAANLKRHKTLISLNLKHNGIKLVNQSLLKEFERMLKMGTVIEVDLSDQALCSDGFQEFV